MGSKVVWEGSKMTQEDFMAKDQVIVVDDNDMIIGKGSKYDTHRFIPGQPRGVLHRAFSVFLFNSEGKLLLQQRAKEKITFPDVWTNTCCSHPLMGFDPTEVDFPEDLANGTVMGVKRAAVRKLKHELGIPESAIQLSEFKFLTRLHYYAADTLTHGKHSPWGEHEIDYILFAKTDSILKLEPHPDEVQNTKWVSHSELLTMMVEPGLLWSPWFKIIAERWLIPLWWKDLHITMTTDIYVDLKAIHRFDPPPSHRGGAGVCGLISSSNGAKRLENIKQGAYGKVPVFTESKFKQCMHIDEIFMMVTYKISSSHGKSKMHIGEDSNGDRKFCDEMLGKVSRSFSAVIRQLPSKLCIEVAIFYLTLRALDTVEDDMNAFSNPADKIYCLVNFYRTVLVGDQMSLGSKGGEKGRQGLDQFLTGEGMIGIGEGDERKLLEQFKRVNRVYSSLNVDARTVISDITRDMGAGMAEFVSKDLGQGTSTLEEYNTYCHYVAGLVGQGLSRLFVATQVEKPQIANRMDLANSMGLFLQKTNIIRDYLEDYVDGRAFWPAEIWKKHAAKTGLLGEFSLPQNRTAARACLNELITDALEHVPDCLEYMDQCQNPAVFRFCAIPQVMAAATLAQVYDNPLLFEGVVKLRKGLAVKMIMGSDTPEGLAQFIQQSVLSIRERIRSDDPSAQRTTLACEKLLDLLYPRVKKPKISVGFAICFAFIVLLKIRYLLTRLEFTESFLPVRFKSELNIIDLLSIVVVVVGILRLLSWIPSLERSVLKKQKQS